MMKLASYICKLRLILFGINGPIVLRFAKDEVD